MKIKSKKIFILIIILTILLTSCLISGGGFLIYKYLIKPSTEKTETILNDQNIIEQVSFNYDDEKDESAIGYLTIEKIGLMQAPIKEGTDENTLNKYIGHFSDSAFLEGNVALAGHNRGYEKNYFENLKDLKGGELIIYQTRSEAKVYKVTEIKKVNESNVDIIKNTKDNRITLITCVENKPKERLVIVGKEI